MTAGHEISGWIGALEQRVGDLERIAQRGASPLGFHVTRTTNDAAIATGNTDDITWNNVVEATWSTLDTFTSGDALTVPSGAGGIYVFAGEVYWATSLANVAVSVTKNAALSLVQSSFGSATVDRWPISGVGRLAAGDVVRLRVFNLSGSTLTPTTSLGDANTPQVPFLRAWRISV